MKKTLKIATYATLTTLLLSTNCIADDISDTIQEAMNSYKKGDYIQAKEDLTYAMELLKQKKGDSIKTILPNPLKGWEAEEATSETAGNGMFGGGSTISRVYKKDNSKITLSIVTDSPLLQGLGSIMGNPMFASGGKLKRINREKATIKYNKKHKSGEITLMIDKRFLITVKGTKVTEDDLVNYVKAIDFKKLKEQ